MNFIFVYGPPGSGKTTLGRALAESLEMPFTDLDQNIVQLTGSSIAEIFSQEGEAGFRMRERLALRTELNGPAEVLALGGGTLLDLDNRQAVEAAGAVLCLTAPLGVLLVRLNHDGIERPLLSSRPRNGGKLPDGRVTADGSRLEDLLGRREDHYASFPVQLNTSQGTPAELAWQAQVRLGRFRVGGMGAAAYDAQVKTGSLDQIGNCLRQSSLDGPVVVVTDSNVAPLYGQRAVTSLEKAGYQARLVALPAGEANKTIQSVQELWGGFVEAGLERASTVLSLGGGMVSDLAGFAAGAYLRGLRWAALPTSLLAMIDAALGGKTGADLPQGKNLVGMFHPPALVLADPELLDTLPQAEMRSGLAEAIKTGVIGDPVLFELCSQGWPTVQANLDEIVRRGMAVKIEIVQADPYEKGPRAALNLGHTLGHALELASDFELRHGEAVGIGMVAAAALSERLGLAESGLADRIRSALAGLGLPVEIPSGLDHERIIAAMAVDKKRRSGLARLALPVRIGEVRVGVMVERVEELLDG